LCASPASTSTARSVGTATRGDLDATTPSTAGLPQWPRPPSRRAVPIYPGGSEQVPMSVASPFREPSPFPRDVGVCDVTFEACSGFTRVTARSVATPPCVGFVSRLRPARLPGRTARQL
jgi:hypothetical protein